MSFISGPAGRWAGVFLLGCFFSAWSVQAAVAVQAGDAVYVLEDPEDREALLMPLSESDRASFEQKRIDILQQAVPRVHASRVIRWGCLVGQTARRVWSADCDASPPVHRQAVQYMAGGLNRFLFEHAGLLVDSDVHGFQVSLGGAYGGAIYRWGSAQGFWLTLHFDRLHDAMQTRVTFDRESLVRTVPAVFTLGIAVKGLFFFGKHSHHADRGSSIYPAVLPHVQLTQRTAAVGYSFGLFMPPAPYTLYLEQGLKRSRSFTLPSPGRMAKQSWRYCEALLQSLGLSRLPAGEPTNEVTEQAPIGPHEGPAVPKDVLNR